MQWKILELKVHNAWKRWIRIIIINTILWIGNQKNQKRTKLLRRIEKRCLKGEEYLGWKEREERFDYTLTPN